MVELSIVIPVLDEEQTLPAMHERLVDVLGDLGVSSEVIFVDDGSRDGTEHLLAAMNAGDPRFKSIHFSRNFGHQAAVSAGLRYTAGRAVVVMDGDLQDPPELLPQLLAKWREGFEVVYAQRAARQQEGWFKRGCAYVFYRLLQGLSEVHIPTDTGDFCLMDRRVVDELNALPERNRYVRGLRAWLGFRQTAVRFDRPPRYAGDVKYTFLRLVGLGLNGVVSFSKVPLRLSTYLGLTVSAMSFLLGMIFIVEKIVGSPAPRGWASIIVVVLFLGGVQLLTIGIAGEYLIRIYEEVKQRPPYIVRTTEGFDPQIRVQESRRKDRARAHAPTLPV